MSPDSWSRGRQIRRIQIILAGNADERKQRIPPGIGQCRAHAMWGGRVADGTDRPIGGNPFSRSMGQNRAEPDDPDGLIY